MVETLKRPNAYKISTVNDGRFVLAKEIAGVLQKQELSMCQPDQCGIDYANCGTKISDTCGIDFV
ncbi:MAG: hypothetical protein ACOVSW_14030 [Candidatus Kapaibacteriota bacterium]